MCGYADSCSSRHNSYFCRHPIQATGNSQQVFSYVHQNVWKMHSHKLSTQFPSIKLRTCKSCSLLYQKSEKTFISDYHVWQSSSIWRVFIQPASEYQAECCQLHRHKTSMYLCYWEHISNAVVVGLSGGKGRPRPHHQLHIGSYILTSTTFRGHSGLWAKLLW